MCTVYTIIQINVLSDILYYTYTHTAQVSYECFYPTTNCTASIVSTGNTQVEISASDIPEAAARAASLTTDVQSPPSIDLTSANS